MEIAFITIVLSISPGKLPEVSEVVTSHGTYTISHKVIAYSICLQTLNFSLDEKQPIVIVADTTSKAISMVFDVMQDEVRVIEQDKGSQDRLKIFFIRRPSPVYLNKSRSGFDKILAELRFSLDKKMEILVGVNPANNLVETAERINK